MQCFNYSENYLFYNRKCSWWVVTWGRAADGVLNTGFLHHIFLRIPALTWFSSYCKAAVTCPLVKCRPSWPSVQLSPVILCSFSQAENAWERGRESMLRSTCWKAQKYCKVHLSLWLNILCNTGLTPSNKPGLKRGFDSSLMFKVRNCRFSPPLYRRIKWIYSVLYGESQSELNGRKEFLGESLMN